MLPQIVTIDSTEITPKERITAFQALEELVEELESEIHKKEQEEKKKSPEERANQYTGESRREMYKELQAEEQKREEEKKGKKEPPKPPSSRYNKEGELRQCNEGRYEYKLREWDDPEFSFFEMPIPLFIDTSNIEFELFPNFVSVRLALINLD